MALLLKRVASSRSFLSIRYSIHQSRSISSLNTISEASGFNHLGSELLREATQNGKGTAEVMETAKSMMEAAINALPREPSKLRRGRATAGMLDHIIVDNGGVKLPLHRVALISIKDPKTVSVTPYDPNVIKEVESAIVSSPLGLNPQVDGQRLFAPIRPLSREHMQAIRKVVTKSGEDAKRSIKIARQNALDTIHKAASKDAVGKLEKEIDELSNKFLKSAEDMCKPPVRQRERALRQFTYGQGKSAGRNSLGRITIFHRGGGAKRLQRRIDMKRSTSSMGVVEKIEYDPNRSARIALVRWIEGVQLRRQKSIQEFAPPPKFLQPTIQTQFPFSSLPGKGSYNTCTRDVFFSALSSPKAKGETPSFRLPRMAVAGAKPAFFLPLSGENNFCLSQVGKWKRHITMKRKAAVSWQSLKHRFVEAEEPKPKTNQGSLPAKTTKDDRAPFSYIIASHQMEVGKMVINTDSSEQGGSRYDSIVDTNSQIGNCMPLNNMRIGTWVHDIEANPGEGAKLVRSAGAYAKILKEPGKECVLRLPSGAEKVIDARCRATIGIVSNITHGSRKLKKAGNSRWLGKRPVVRGVAMNPVDHPHGGGEGRAKGGRPSVTPWGKPTKSGYKTGAGKRTKK